MKTLQHELWTRLENYTPDDEGAFPYSARLARENDWPPDYVRRVIHEYKRFAFLAMVAGHPVTPSDQVDQAWHLHLLYTRSYWDGFCGRVLGRPLHHEPTRGGAAERGKFEDWYERTRQSYRDWFGETPPEDIWPDARRRFGEDVEFVRVNVARHWVVPKLGRGRRLLSRTGHRVARGVRSMRSWGRRMGLALAIVAIGSTVLAGCREFAQGAGSAGSGGVDGGMRWGSFLGWLVFLGIAWIVRRRLCVGDSVAAEAQGAWEDTELERIEPAAAAYLAGGPVRVVEAALAELATREVITVDADTGRVSPAGPLPEDLGPMERAIHEGLSAATPNGIGRMEIRKQAAPLIAVVEEALIRRGWVLAPDRRAAVVMVPLTIAMVVPVFLALLAMSEFANGGSFAVACGLCGIAGLPALLVFGRGVRRTRRGDEVLERLQRRHESLRDWRANSPPEAGWAMAVGLFGLMALEAGRWDGVATALRAREDTRAGGCGGGCGGGSGDAGCGADGGGGCGSGCGGGGCGGCGGCGG